MANVNDVRAVGEQCDNEIAKLRDPADVTGGRATLTDPDGDVLTEGRGDGGDPVTVAEADRKALLAFADHFRRRASEWTFRTYMSRLRTSAHRTDMPLVDYEGVTDVDVLLGDHEAAGCKSASGLNTHLASLRKFLTWLDSVPEHGRDSYRWVERVKNVKPNGTNGGPEPVDPEFVLSGGEVNDLADAAGHPRDAALIQFLADPGPRISLALQMKVGDVEVPAGEPGTFRPNPEGEGQKGVPTDKYRLHESQHHLRRWINEFHPDPHPDAPLFPKRRGYDKDDRENGAIHPATARDNLKAAAERAGIDPERVHPHNFRKTAVTRMRVKHDMSWTAIQHRTGWSDQSLAEMKEIYRRIDEEERMAVVDRELGVAGDDEDTPAPTPEPCGNCGRELDPDMRLCPYCGADPDAGAPTPANTLADQIAAAVVQRTDGEVNESAVKAQAGTVADKLADAINDAVATIDPDPTIPDDPDEYR